VDSANGKKSTSVDGWKNRWAEENHLVESAREELHGGEETKRKAAEKELNQELIKAPDAITLCAIQRATLSPTIPVSFARRPPLYGPLFRRPAYRHTPISFTHRAAELSPFAVSVCRKSAHNYSLTLHRKSREIKNCQRQDK